VTDSPHHYPFRYQGGHAGIDNVENIQHKHRFYTQRAVLCATCVTVVVVTSGGGLQNRAFGWRAQVSGSSTGSSLRAAKAFGRRCIWCFESPLECGCETDPRGDTLKMTAKVFGFEQDGSFVNT
jgi:hypothetical protein